jgi:hypothetical protein
MSLGTHTGNQPWDVRTRQADLTDGIGTTLLLGEHILAGSSAGTPYSGGLPTNWACPLPNFTLFLGSDDVCHTSRSTTDCLGGQLRPTPEGNTGPGWARANRQGSGEGINDTQGLKIEGAFPFASGAHSCSHYPSGGAVFGFCDGAVRFVSETIDGTVYARLITPAGESLPATLRQSRGSPDEFFGP